MGKAIKSRPTRRSYATRAVVNRAIDIARANGIAVNGLALLPDGTVRITTESNAAARAETAFDTWDKAGRL